MSARLFVVPIWNFNQLGWGYDFLSSLWVVHMSPSLYQDTNKTISCGARICYWAFVLYVCQQVCTMSQFKPTRMEEGLFVEHLGYTYVTKSSHKQNILSVARNCNRTFVLYICQQVCTMSQFKPTLMEEGLLSSIGVTRESASLFLLTI